jgi:hypothetical protein
MGGTPWLKVEFGVMPEQPRWSHPAVAAATGDTETRDVHWLDRWFPDNGVDHDQPNPEEPVSAPPRSQDILDMEASLGVKQPFKLPMTPQVGFWLSAHLPQRLTARVPHARCVH